MSIKRTYSHNNGALGIWRAVVMKDCGDGKAYVYIPALHKNRNPFKMTKSETDSVENQSSDVDTTQPSTDVNLELKDDVAEEIGIVPENDSQFSTSTNDSNESWIDKLIDTENNESEEVTVEGNNPNHPYYPKANIQSWQLRPPLKTGDAVWVIFENGNIQYPTIVGQLGTVLPLGNLQGGGGGVGNTTLDLSYYNGDATDNNTGSKVATGTALQQTIANYAQSFGGTGIGAKGGYCEAWNEQVYRACGVNVSYQSSGKAAGLNFGHNSDMSNVPIGASIWAIYDPYGHAAIYIGNGKIASNVGGNIPRIETVENFNTWASKKPGFTSLVWGWPDNIDLSIEQGV